MPSYYAVSKESWECNEILVKELHIHSFQTKRERDGWVSLSPNRAPVTRQNISKRHFATWLEFAKPNSADGFSAIVDSGASWV